MAKELTTLQIESAIAPEDELYFNDKSENPNDLKRITFEDLQSQGLGSFQPDSLSSTYNNDLVEAIATIGATKKTLLVDEDASVSVPVIIPANLVLQFKNGALLNKTVAGSIEFEGMGLADPESQTPIFSGFAAGDITWTGATPDLRPASISTELWDTGNDSLMDRLKRANEAISGSYWKRIIAHPREIDGTIPVSFRTRTEVYFLSGDYEYTFDGFWGGCFEYNNNTVFHGTWAARLGERGAAGQQVFQPPGRDSYGQYENLVIKDLAFVGNPAGSGSSAGSKIALGNLKNGVIERCLFDRTHEYTILVGGYGDQGFYADGVEIRNNRFINNGTQVIAPVNARNTVISGNYFDQRNSNSFATYTIIDAEPNTEDDIIDNLIIEDNVFDLRDTPTSLTFDSDDVDTAQNTITISTIGMDQSRTITFTTTGTLPAPLAPATTYYPLIIDGTTIRVSSTFGGAAIDLTDGGTGTHAVTSGAKYNVAILVQGTDHRGNRNVTIRNNTLFDSYILPEASDPTHPGGYTLIAIAAGSTEEVYIYGNTVRGGSWVSIGISECRDARVFDNTVILGNTIKNVPNQIQIEACADSDIYNNNISFTTTNEQLFPPPYAGIYENDRVYPVTVADSAVTLLWFTEGNGFIARVHKHVEGLTVTINTTDYIIDTVTGPGGLTLGSSAGTIPQSSFTSSDVSGDIITVPSHGFVTGAEAFLITSGVLPAHTPPTVDVIAERSIYYIIRMDDNSIKVANSLANALAGTAITLTDGGTGTHKVNPLMRTKYSSNRFSQNKTPSGIRLDPQGSSQIVSSYDDHTITNVADADHTATSNSGIIVYTSLSTGRTVTLPTAVTCKGKEIVIKDGSGDAGTHNITVDGNGSETVDGAANTIISTNYGKVTVKSTGSAWITL